MISTILNRLAVAAIFSVFVVGCTTKGGADSVGANDTATQIGTDGTINGQELVSGQQLNADDAAKLAAAGFKVKNIVYFDVDSSQLKTDDEKTVEEHAQYLINNPSIKILLEGHADERGSREYNMALGEKRAFSIKQRLQLQGVAKHQIQTVSFGEERPDLDGHDESAWSKNRRAVFVYASN